MTEVAFTVAVAGIPSRRPSSSTESRVIAAVIRWGPASISTSAITPETSTDFTIPGKRLRADRLLFVSCRRGAVETRSTSVRAIRRRLRARATLALSRLGLLVCARVPSRGPLSALVEPSWSWRRAAGARGKLVRRCVRRTPGAVEEPLEFSFDESQPGVGGLEAKSAQRRVSGFFAAGLGIEGIDGLGENRALSQE